MEILLIFENEVLNNFWKITVQENKYMVSYGKHGTTGAVKIKEFDSSENCMNEASLKIRAKLQKGYQPVEFSGQIIKESQMSHEDFWKLIEHAKKKGNRFDEQLEFLLGQLTKKPIKEIVRFDSIFHDYFKQSYTSDLWAAAYIILGGCSDDCFDYFRAWLLYLGKDNYERAIADPETIIPHLKKLDGELSQLEELSYLACSAYEEKTGLDDGSYYDLYEQLTGAPFGNHSIELNWNEADEKELKKKFPRLWAIYGENPLEF